MFVIVCMFFWRGHETLWHYLQIVPVTFCGCKFKEYHRGISALHIPHNHCFSNLNPMPAHRRSSTGASFLWSLKTRVCKFSNLFASTQNVWMLMMLALCQELRATWQLELHQWREAAISSMSKVMEKADASWHVADKSLFMRARLDLILPLWAGSNRQGAQAVELLLTVDVQGMIMYDTIWCF